MNGQLVALPESGRTLSGDNTGPALVVTERLTNLIDTYAIGDDGLATIHQTFTSPGADPFGIAVGRHDHIFVSEATQSTVSFYAVSDNGGLGVINASVPTKQNAACWLTLTPNE